MIEVLLLQIRKFYCIGDFNVEIWNPHMSEIRALFNLKNLVKGLICLKNFDKPICIDHILTNHPYCFSWFMCVSYMTFYLR